MTNLDKVAQVAGVSRTTVSRYLNRSGYVSQEAARRIEMAISQLGYLPNRIAKSLVMKKTLNIALVVSDISNPITASYAKGVEDEAFERGYNVILCNTGFDLEREQKVVRVLLEKQIDGIIMAPCRKGEDHILEIQKRGIPIVFLTRRVQNVAADYVRFDYVGGSFQIVEYLIQRGHRRIGIFSPPVPPWEGEERIHGYLKALATYGIPFDPSLVIIAEAVEGVAYRKIRELLSLPQPPTAIFTAVNLFAKDIIRFCREHGINIPEDLSLASFEQFPHYDSVILPSLLANEMPAYELGRKAAEALFERMFSGDRGWVPKNIVLKGGIREGNSVRSIVG
jgi:LacI family transcriptional regulator